jgi:hypothetical protein
MRHRRPEIVDDVWLGWAIIILLVAFVVALK